MPTQSPPPAFLTLIRQALREDLGSGDLTSRAVIPAKLRVRARIVAKERGVVSGVKMATLTFGAVDRSVRSQIRRHSGDAVTPGTVILTVEGKARSIFEAERVALNFLGHFSGISTLTSQFVKRIKGTRAKILDTRKTIPGLRLLQKYAVAAGGGQNHRLGLYDAVLIKTNHLRASHLSVEEAVRKSRRTAGRKEVTIEVSNRREFQAALRAKPDVIMLDNWRVPAIRNAVKLRRGSRPLLEVSGGVTLKNVRAIAKAGVDRISIGRLTHSAPSLDVALRVEPPELVAWAKSRPSP
jgi:nicotinate-nucleotide pyrophosphorylase (carboxylating)